MRRILGYFSEFSIFGIVGLILIVGPLNFGSRAHDAQGWLHLAAIALLPFWMIRLVCLAEPFVIWTRITLPLVLFTGYVLVSYLFSDVKWLARQEFLMVSTYAILFLAVVNNLQRRWQLQALFWLIAVVAAAEAIDGIVRHYHGSSSTVCRFFFFDCVQRQGAQNVTRAGGTFYTPDHYAAFLEIGLALIAAHLVILKRAWTRKVFLIYLAGCLLFAIAFSRSRGGWITLLCLIPFLVLLVVRGRFLNSRSALVGVILLAAAVFLLYRQHGLVSERLRDLFAHGEPTRFKLYTSALQMAKEHPVFGVGPQLFQVHFPRYHYLAEEPEFVHSEVLQVLADQGVVGVALLGWLVFALFHSGFQMTRAKEAAAAANASKDVSQRLSLAIGGMAVAFAIMVHSLFDFVLHVMGVGVALTVAVALMFCAAALRRKRSETELDAFGFEETCRMIVLSPRQQQGLLVAIGIIFLGLFPLALNNLLAMRWSEQAEALAYAAEWDDPEAAEALYQRAIRADSRNYRTAVALGNFYFGRGGNDPEANKEIFDKAMHWYGHAIRSHPYYAPALQLRAQIYTRLYEVEKAHADCERLLQVSPHNPAVRVVRGEVCLMEADYECARENFELARQLADVYNQQTAKIAEEYLELIKDAPRPEDPQYE